MKQFLIIQFLCLSSLVLLADKVKFTAVDGVEVTAELHIAHPKTAPMIVLFHQAGWSRGEYLEIAPTLNQLGYNCLAVDLRSGNLVNGVRNETKQSAKSKMKQTRYVDAYVDLEAAIKYAKDQTTNKLIIWGSSYSSALVLKYAGDNPEMVQAVLSFSPGEYFKSQGKPSDWISQSAANIQCPVFITSAKNEQKSWQTIYDIIPVDTKQFYLPTQFGNHGSRALWVKFDSHKGYWEAVIAFLQSLEP